MKTKIRVLFICTQNSARSQIAEAYLNKLGDERFFVESAGTEPGKLNNIVVEVLKEDGLDISGNKTKSVFELYREGRVYNYVIAVCDKTTAEKCPVFPGVIKRLEWSFPDPAKLNGNYEDKIMGTRVIRNQIKDKIKEWIQTFDLKKAEESLEE